MVITHAVVDIERWVNGKAERAATIGAFATNVTDYVAADGSQAEVPLLVHLGEPVSA
jgi:hypothetical protein